MDKRQIQLCKPDLITGELKEKFEKFPNFYRISGQFNRHYVTIKDNKVNWFPSVTTVIYNTIPKSKGLEMLMVQKGEKFHEWFNELANQGTFIHKEIGNYFIDGLYSFEGFEDRIKAYFDENKLTYSVKSWLFEIRPKIVSFLRFIQEHEIEPLAIEIIVGYEDGNIKFAGALDLVCYITLREKGFHGEVYKSGKNIGEPKETHKKVRKLAFLDWKSGVSGFHKEYELQLLMYAKAFEQMTGIQPEALINVAPKQFMNGNTPNYQIKDWMKDPKNGHMLDKVLDMYFMEYEKPQEYPVFDGVMTSEDHIDSIFKYVDADEYVKSLTKIKENETVEELQPA